MSRPMSRAWYTARMRALALLVLVLGCDPTVTRAPDAGVPPDPCAPNVCAAVTPVDGGCLVDVVPACAECSTPRGLAGTSRDGGPCCSGCWAGAACRTRPDALGCGANGSLCVPCNGSQVCVDGACTNGPRRQYHLWASVLPYSALDVDHVQVVCWRDVQRPTSDQADVAA